MITMIADLIIVIITMQNLKIILVCTLVNRCPALYFLAAT